MAVEVLGQGRVGILPQLLVHGRAFLAPPEPRSCLSAAAFGFVEGSPYHRNSLSFELLELSRERLKRLTVVVVFLRSLGVSLLGREIVILGAVRSLSPVYTVADGVAFHLVRHIDVEGSRSYAVLFLYPLDDALCGAVVAAVCGTAEIAVVKAADSGIMTRCILEILKLGLKSVRTAAVYLLLTRDYVLSVHAVEVSHKALGLLGSERVTRSGLRSLDVGQNSSAYGEVVEHRPAPRRLDLQRILARIELDCGLDRLVGIALGNGERAL